MNLPLAWNADFIQSRYERWKSDPHSVPRDWQMFFEGFSLAGTLELGGAPLCDAEHVLRQARVEELVHRYRDLGHLLACLDPLVSCPTSHPLLDPDRMGLGDEDLERIFFTPHLPGMEQAPLKEILGMLRETYCRSVGVEYMHLQDPDERRWLQDRMEPTRNRSVLDGESRRWIWEKLCRASLFEQFLHTRYLGQKRFSAEGAEVVVPALADLLDHSAASGVEEVVLGMAHRGRLNVQVNVLGKPYEAVFCEFEDHYDPDSLVGSGDVKYHHGYMAHVSTRSGRKIRALLADNPSHLESVDPVIEGIARARQDLLGKDGIRRVLPVLIHGDAAFAGQGVVSETLNLSQLEGYLTGGTIHLVINNQIGFTTLPEHARSTRYSTDIAKMLMVPIFHVHGEDPEAAVHVIRLAYDYRFRFHKDVVIDIVCFRRYGHNEGDEPYYTQPTMYERIKDRPPLFRLYGRKLMDEGVLTREEAEESGNRIHRELEDAYRSSRDKTCAAPEMEFYEAWREYHGDLARLPDETGVDSDTLRELARQVHQLPPDLSVHPRLERILRRRAESVSAGEGLDWATGEMLAFASLLDQGISIRLSGQDSRRGTFSQRHGVLVDTRTGACHTPLDRVARRGARLSVYDSMLSENAVLGFEYGYSIADPRPLVLWEAQFGDFANNAQVIIDQYLSSGELKWGRLSGLVLLLPHAYEGQGPEHSSARLERFLQLCAQDNLQVVYPTTPAQYFHLLRRQVLGRVRKPLVVLTPKSLLRHPRAVSSLGELSGGGFRPVLGPGAPTQNPHRILFCTGKVYYDLVERLDSRVESPGIAILRIEQLYPFPENGLREALAGWESAAEWVWVQEEPQNMGAWSYLRPLFEELLPTPVRYVGRPPSASPVTGYHGIYEKEQKRLLEEALG